MERPEVPLEAAQEHIHHHARHAPEERRWILGVALSTAVVAALAAVASFQAGHLLNEALLDQLHSNEKWAYYQTRGIKATVLTTKIDLLTALDKPVSEQDRADATRFNTDIDKIKDDARELGKSSAHHLERHELLSSAVTMYQVCIAVAAVSVLTSRRWFWFVSLAFAVGGIVYTVMGLFGH